MVQLCRGATAEERQRLSLPAEPEGFAYLAGSGCTTIAGVDDAAGFGTLRQAMAAVGIADAAQQEVWQLLAGLLHLGNVGFRRLSDDASTVDKATLPALQAAAALLGCPAGDLEHALVTRRLAAGGELVVRHLSADAAADNRDALAKAAYAALFAWLVEQVGCGGEGAVGWGAWGMGELGVVILGTGEGCSRCSARCCAWAEPPAWNHQASTPGCHSGVTAAPCPAAPPGR